MHHGAPPPGRLTVNDVESRQGQAWDEMMHVQVEETIQQFVDEMQTEMEGSILSDFMTAELRRLRRRPPTRPSGLQISETRTSRYNTVRDQEYGRASKYRADWAQTMIWEHVGPEDVLANPDREFETCTAVSDARPSPCEESTQRSFIDCSTVRKSSHLPSLRSCLHFFSYAVLT